MRRHFPNSGLFSSENWVVRALMIVDVLRVFNVLLGAKKHQHGCAGVQSAAKSVLRWVLVEVVGDAELQSKVIGGAGRFLRSDDVRVTVNRSWPAGVIEVGIT